MNIETFREMALSFPGTIEAPHFDRTAFKVEYKRTYATLLEENRLANVKLPVNEQEVFCAIDNLNIYVVPNKWGVQGWTTFNLESISEKVMLDALNTAYHEVVGKKK
jgi:hypothetical protein